MLSDFFRSFNYFTHLLQIRHNNIALRNINDKHKSATRFDKTRSERIKEPFNPVPNYIVQTKRRGRQ